MRFDFTRSDLLPGISDKELTALTEKLIADGEPSDKVERVIAEQADRVERYIRRYTLTEDHWKGLLRPLVILEIYPRLSTPPEKRKDAAKTALAELTQIRDGKFPDLPLSDPVPEDITGAGRGRWGSGTKLTTR